MNPPAPVTIAAVAKVIKVGAWLALVLYTGSFALTITVVEQRAGAKL